VSFSLLLVNIASISPPPFSVVAQETAEHAENGVVKGREGG